MARETYSCTGLAVAALGMTVLLKLFAMSKAFLLRESAKGRQIE